MAHGCRRAGGRVNASPDRQGGAARRRQRLRAAWQGTIWEQATSDAQTAELRQAACHGGPPSAWRRLAAQGTACLLLTACNPDSRPLPGAINARRDRALRNWLQCTGEPGCIQRVRARRVDGRWREDGWSVPWPGQVWRQRRLLDRLRHAGQAAALLMGGGCATLLWADGGRERWRLARGAWDAPASGLPAGP